MILLTGMDETFSQEVHSRSSYRADEIVFGAKFVSMFDFDDEHGVNVDFNKMHEFEKMVLPANAN